VPIERPGARVLTGWAAVVTAVAITLAGCGHLGGSDEPAAPGAAAGQSAPVTSTTKVASAGVLGNDRRPDESCAPEPAAVDPGATADPQRIVVLGAGQLDALCALGLQSRIVGAALPDGSDAQPSYLGTVIHDVAPVGSRTAPDLGAIRAAAPDLILAPDPLTPDAEAGLAAIAPTVSTGPDGARWRDDLRAVAAATGRADAGAALVGGFDDAARRSGAESDATHFQASVVELTETTMRIYGTENFAGSVLTAVGVDRPAAQRFTDKPYVEIGITDTDLDNAPDFSAAEGDIVYISFGSPAARDRAPKVLDSPAWRALSANKDNRVFAVNNEVWQTGQGVVAARGIMTDLRWVNAPIN
jgi:iron complex transport system substrate-binding protein